MAGNKFIYILIGPKGSGKSFIGDLFDKYFQVHFVKVENWAREIKKDREPEDENYIREFFEIIEKAIRDHMNHYDNIVFESTGITRYFDAMCANLQSTYHVTLIKIHTDPELCLARIRKRDQSIHINISDDQVNKINEAVKQKNIDCEYIIENSRATKEELCLKIEKIIRDVNCD